MTEIRQTLRSFIRENFLFGEKDAFADDDSLLGLGIIDSTGVLELVTFLENEYRIAVADEELVPDNLDSIANLTRFITAKRVCSGAST